MDADSATVGGLPSGRFSGRHAFQQVVRDALACAAQEGWRELLLCDASYEDWPLHEHGVCASLGDWARSGRRFVMIASTYDVVVRQHARFVAWRKTWGHIIDCRLVRHIDPADFPSALLAPAWMMQRLDPVHCTGVASERADRRVQLRETVDELLLRSGPGFPASVLGL